MNGVIEKPFLNDVRQNFPKGQQVENLQKEIRKLCEEQPFAVLATQGKDITDASLVTIAVSKNLKYIAFATPVNTGKYKLISENENISILVDDRTLHQDSINQISALTVIGKARILSDNNETLQWAAILTEKHPFLHDFVKAPSSAMILIEVERYLYVKRFQDLWEWNPK